MGGQEKQGKPGRQGRPEEARRSRGCQEMQGRPREAGEARGAREAGEARRGPLLALAQHVPAAELLFLPLLQVVFQKPQLPTHHLPHGQLQLQLQLQHFLKVCPGLRLIPHLLVSPGPHIVGLHDP